MQRKCTSFRLSEEALRLLAKLADRDGIETGRVLEILIRKQAREIGIPEEDLCQ
jgi:hypothetical protein